MPGTFFVQLHIIYDRANFPRPTLEEPPMGRDLPQWNKVKHTLCGNEICSKWVWPLKCFLWKNNNRLIETNRRSSLDLIHSSEPKNYINNNFFINRKSRPMQVPFVGIFMKMLNVSGQSEHLHWTHTCLVVCEIMPVLLEIATELLRLEVWVNSTDMVLALCQCKCPEGTTTTAGMWITNPSFFSCLLCMCE